jgi:hypothetical protein
MFTTATRGGRRRRGRHVDSESAKQVKSTKGGQASFEKYKINSSSLEHTWPMVAADTTLACI